MDFFSAIFLGALQGITEFLPISSSGHLILAEYFLVLPVANLAAFDVVLHGGTLLALIILFWREWWNILCGVSECLLQRQSTAGRESLMLFAKLVVATIPAAIIGLLWGDQLESVGRDSHQFFWSGVFFLIGAALLALAEWNHKRGNGFFARLARWFEKMRNPACDQPNWRQVIIMAIFQAIALLPAVSRSGSTIAAGMLAGLPRAAAARFSFLMLTPATAGAVILVAKDAASGQLVLPAWPYTLAGFTVSAVVSYGAARWLLGFVRQHSLLWFSGYLVCAAALLFILAGN